MRPSFLASAFQHFTLSDQAVHCCMQSTDNLLSYSRQYAHPSIFPARKKKVFSRHIEPALPRPVLHGIPRSPHEVKGAPVPLQSRLHQRVVRPVGRPCVGEPYLAALRLGVIVLSHIETDVHVLPPQRAAESILEIERKVSGRNVLDVESPYVLGLDGSHRMTSHDHTEDSEGIARGDVVPLLVLERNTRVHGSPFRPSGSIRGLHPRESHLFPEGREVGFLVRTRVEVRTEVVHLGGFHRTATGV
mmetsp:Transcript_41909/g.127092  ORF Transcript_41909/g.127092 Transcript_41909/m.127092 type:complete len:246 (-) Transcript_41909:157-894(-)